MTHVLLVLLDGVGAGRRDPDVNPLARPGFRYLGNLEDDPPGKPLPRGGRYVPLDACLGVEGLPQSPTGQTALLTGVNAPAAIGRHLPGFPNAALREILRRRSLLRTATERGRRAAFLNAYGPRFFELRERLREAPRSASTLANRAAGLPFASLDDLRAGRAVYHDLTSRDLVARGHDVPVLGPEEAGLIAAARLREVDLLFFETFRTDLAGHARDADFALEEAARFELFLESLLAASDPADTLVLVAADHGNLEDLTFRGHTRNPAQGLVFGAGADPAAERLSSLVDVVPVILHALGIPGET